MTLQEAILDKKRPLSMTPQEWMQYTQAKDYQEEEIVEGQVKHIISQEQKIPQQQIKYQIDCEQKLQIGIQQMILGCRISLKSLQQIDRKNLSSEQRKVYNKIKYIMNNAIAPYLSDILQERKQLYK